MTVDGYDRKTGLRTRSHRVAVTAVTAALAAASLTLVAAPAQAATITQTVTVTQPGLGTFRIPSSATGISVTLKGAAGWGSVPPGSTTSTAGLGGVVTLDLAAVQFAGRSLDYVVGAVGDTARGYGSGGGGTAIGSLPSQNGRIYAVVGGGGAGGAAFSTTTPGLKGGNGGVAVGASTSNPDVVPGGDGQAVSSTAFGRGGSTVSPGTGGRGGTTGGSPGGDVPVTPTGSAITLAAGGAPYVDTSPGGLAAGGGGGGYTGGGGGGRANSPVQQFGAGGGGAGAFDRSIAGLTARSASRGTNAGGGSFSITYTMTALAATAPGLPPGITQGVAFNTARASATGGEGLYTYSLGTGTLPAGVSIDPGTGIIFGTPTQYGVFSFALRVTDESPVPQTVDLPLSLTVRPAALTVSAPTAGTGKIGQPLSWKPVTATGGATPYVWSLATGVLPAGLTLDPATGVVSGTPATTGTTTGLSFRVRDSWSPVATATSTATTLTIGSTALTAPASARAGTPITITASALAPGTYTAFLDTTSIGSAVVGADGLLSVVGQLPTTLLSTRTLSVRYGGVAIGSRTMTVLPPPMVVTSASPPDGRVGTAYSAAAVTVSGGAGPFIYAPTTPLPPGLTLSPTTGVLSGTPTSYRDYGFSVRVSDAETGANAQTATVDVLLTVAPAAMVVTALSPAPVRQGQPYSTSLVSVSGGGEPYTFEPVGTLPPGLDFDTPTGVLSGTPTAAGRYTFRVAVTDSWGATQTITSGDVTVEVLPAVMTVAPATMPAGTVGQAYSASPVAVTGGAGPFTYTPTTTLPAGLTLDPTTGVLSGTPQSPGTFTIGVTVTDTETAVQTGTASATLTVVPAPLVVTALAPPPARAGQAYSGAVVSVSGGVAPYAYEVVGSLPPGLTLDPTSGVLSGSPTTTGVFGFSVRVTDSWTPAASVTSGPVTVTVGLTSLSAPASVRLGDPLEVTAAGLDSGTYALLLDDATLTTGDSDALGALALATTVPPTTTLGAHTISLTRAGVVVGSAVLTVSKALATVTVTSSTPTSVYGGPVTWIASVTAAGGPVSGGRVDFVVGGAVVASGPVVAGVVSSGGVSTVPVGSTKVEARYSGSATATSAKATLKQQVRYGVVITGPSGRVPAGGVVPLSFQLVDASGAPVPDALAAAQVAQPGCGALVSVTGPAPLTPKCATYSAATHTLSVGLPTTTSSVGKEVMTVTLTYPGIVLAQKVTGRFTLVP